jgi:hypothetical protein
MFRFQHLSLSILAVALTASAAGASYMTSFEKADGFTSAYPNAKDGWTASQTAPIVQVVNTTASDGTQSIWIPSNASTNSGITRTFTSTETTAADKVMSFDFMPEINSTAGARTAWFYAIVDNAAGTAAKAVQFYLYNAAAGGTPEFYYKGPSNRSIFVPDTTWTNGQWNTMQVTFNAASQTFDFDINQHRVGTDLAIGSTGATRFSGFRAYEPAPEATTSISTLITCGSSPNRPPWACWRWAERFC